MSGRRRVLLTGATGCVGHEIAARLLEDAAWDVVLLVRDPERLRVAPRLLERAEILRADLREATRHEHLLRSVDAAVLAATSWEHGDESDAVNLDATLALVRALDPARCDHVVYFSTASILRSDGTPLPEAGRIGTGYIRSKFRAREALRAAPGIPPLSALYPTLVIGGGGGAPESHLAKLLRTVARRRLLHRLVTADGSFHVAHSADIAAVAVRLLELGPDGDGRDLVLGGAPVTVDEALDALSAHLGRRRVARVPLSPALAERLLDLLRVDLAPWDRYCMRQRHFTYEGATLGQRLGIAPRHPTLASALASLSLD